MPPSGGLTWLGPATGIVGGLADVGLVGEDELQKRRHRDGGAEINAGLAGQAAGITRDQETDVDLLIAAETTGDRRSSSF